MFGKLEGMEAERPENLKKFIVCLIDTEKERPQLIDTIGGLEEWRRLLQCQVIDIQERYIEGRPFDFICDDEAGLKEGCKVSGINKEQQPELLGNLIICKCDDEGHETGLNKEDIEILKRHFCILGLNEPQEGRANRWAAIGGLEY